MLLETSQHISTENPNHQPNKHIKDDITVIREHQLILVSHYQRGNKSGRAVKKKEKKLMVNLSRTLFTNITSFILHIYII